MKSFITDTLLIAIILTLALLLTNCTNDPRTAAEACRESCPDGVKSIYQHKVGSGVFKCECK